MQIRIIWLEFGQLKGDFQATKIVIDEVARIFHVKHIEFPKLNLFFPKNSNLGTRISSQNLRCKSKMS